MKRNNSWVLCVLLKRALWPLLTAQNKSTFYICCLINNTEFLLTKKMHGRIDGWGKTLKVFYIVFNCQENSTFPRMLAQEIMKILEIIFHIYNKSCTDFGKPQILSRPTLSLHNGINRNTFLIFFFPFWIKDLEQQWHNYRLL